MRHIVRHLMSVRMLGGALMLAASSSALAVTTVDRTINISSGTFNSSIGATGSLTVSGSNLQVSVAPVLGYPIAGVALNLPNQTVPFTLAPNPTPINSPVTGSFVLRGEDAYDAVGPDPLDEGDYQLVPGTDGLFDDGDSANSAMDLIVASINANLINQNFTSNTVQLNGSGTLEFLGLSTFTVGVRIQGAASGNLTAGFNSTGPSTEIVGSQDNSTFPDGSHPFITPALYGATPQGVDNLGVAGLFGLPGDINGNLAAALGGAVIVDLGIFGSITQNISDLAGLNESITQAFALLGNLTAKQIPTASVLSDDLTVTFGYDFSSLPIGDLLNVPVNISGSQVFNIDFDIPINLGFLGTPTIDGSFTGTVNYTLAATINLAPPNYTATGSISNAVNVPEVQTIALLGITGAVGLAIRTYKRRRSA